MILYFLHFLRFRYNFSIQEMRMFENTKNNEIQNAARYFYRADTTVKPDFPLSRNIS